MLTLPPDRSEMARVSRLVPTLVASGVVAILCTLSALDRAVALGARPSPLLTSTGFGVAADRREVYNALSNKEGAFALDLAARIVTGDPVAPDSTALLGTVRLALGLVDPARAAFTVAADMGWRNVTTQLYWLEQAQAIGDDTVASQRIDAGLRVGADPRIFYDAIDLLESSASGRKALAERLAANPKWQDVLIRTIGYAPADSPIIDRIATLREGQREGLALNCAAVASATQVLARNRHFPQAATLWFSLCHALPPASNPIVNGSFDDLPTADVTSAFDWQLVSNGAVDTEVAPALDARHQNALSIRSTSSVREIAARQLVVLKPGNYKVSWTTMTDGAATPSPIIVSVDCAGARPSQADNVIDEQHGRYSLDVAIPAACSIQMIAISVEPRGVTDRATVYIDDLAIHPDMSR